MTNMLDSAQWLTARYARCRLNLGLWQDDCMCKRQPGFPAVDAKKGVTMNERQWELYRLSVAETWPDSPYKAATIAGAAIQLLAAPLSHPAPVPGRAGL